MHMRMSAGEYREYLAKESARKPSKHRNKRVYVYADGFVGNEKLSGHGEISEKYDSVKEYNRSRELRLLERAGKISALREQVPFVLMPEFTDADGKKHREAVYRADFVYLKNGVEVVEDVKGFDERTKRYRTTETFRLKWKLLQSNYPNRVFCLY